MTGLIKGGLVAQEVRPVRSAEPGVDQEILRLRQKVGSLETRLRDSEARIEALADDREATFADGRAVGLGEAQDVMIEMVGALEKGITSAHRMLAEALGGTERLAALLARECLSTLFASSDDRAQLVDDLIRRQMETLEASAVLSVAVSSKDFPDPAACARLSSGPLAGVRIETLDSFASGSCVMTLRLGEIDLGLNQQWGALSGLLFQLSEPDRRL